jgi:Ca-activated chloride channel homolog
LSGVVLAATLGGWTLEQPLWLVAAAVLTTWTVLVAARRPPRVIAWSAWDEAAATSGLRRDWSRGLALALRGGALLLLGLVLAGPVLEDRGPPPIGEGLDIVLVVDASGSMRALDADLDGEWRTRLDLARRVVERFAMDRVAEGDRVALVVFGETAFTQCPLTSDGQLLRGALRRVEAGMAGEATALGDALALAVKRATGGSEPGAATTGIGPTAGRVVVLLTDGRSNAGVVPPDVAAQLARARGVRVHTVGIGSEGDVAMAAPPGATGRGLRFERHDLDADTLAAIADATGGHFFRARSGGDLGTVYEAIDGLERVPRSLPARRRRQPRPEPALALAGALVALEIATARGWLRRIP